jgi:DNA helicase HerA-like ATPase
VVKLVRSKGVGVYFVTQNPIDIPDSVLSQLSNRVQHALRAYTPRDQKAVRVAAETFRTNPAFDTEEAITQLAVGEALVSVLEDKGIPSIVERTFIRPPFSRVGPITSEERKAVMAESVVGAAYNKVEDRESAYELLTKKTKRKVEAEETKEAEEAQTTAPPRPRYEDTNYRSGPPPYRENSGPPPARRTTRGDTVAEAAMKSAARSMATQLGRAIVRGILGSLSRGR